MSTPSEQLTSGLSLTVQNRKSSTWSIIVDRVTGSYAGGWRAVDGEFPYDGDIGSGLPPTRNLDNRDLTPFHGLHPTSAGYT
ncbi:MAG: hypothetical protein GY856_25190 [bacterium]|nr:hypothetical protein [bacterium]